MTRLTLTVPEAAKTLGITTRTAYEQCRLWHATHGAEGIPNLRLGKRVVVPARPARSVARRADMRPGEVAHDRERDGPSTA